MKRRGRGASAAPDTPSAVAALPAAENPPVKRGRGRRPSNFTAITAVNNPDGQLAPRPNSSAEQTADRTTSVAGGRSQDSLAVKDVPEVDPEKLDEKPYAVGYCLLVKYRDNTTRLAKIIESLRREDVQSCIYYVHYFDFNRRMDEWVEEARIVSPPSVANAMEAQYSAHHHPHQPHKDAHSTANLEATAGLSLSPRHEQTSQFTTIAELEHDEHEGMDEAQLIEHEKLTKVKNIQRVQLGKHIMECWYFSPFPKEYYSSGFADCLYFCEYSLRFFTTKDELLRYQAKGFASNSLPRHPPGNEIYRDENVSMFELDGAVSKTYCQNLCYFAKLFLDHKTLFWDVDPFLFYVLCTRDERGFHPVGYFSKVHLSPATCVFSFPVPTLLRYNVCNVSSLFFLIVS